MDKLLLERHIEEFGLNNSKELSDKLEKLMDITLEANSKFNLTAIKEENKFRELMIYDSLVVLKYFDFSNKSVLDIGTGAGFPGLPLALSSKGNFTLLDSTSKKIKHIDEVVEQLEISNVNTVADRVEHYAKDHRESFDVTIARAVASLKILAELTLPLTKVGGTFIAMKGSKADEELEEAKSIIKILGGEINNIIELELPESKEKRTLIFINKVNKTPKKYPRNYSDIVSSK